MLESVLATTNDLQIRYNYYTRRQIYASNMHINRIKGKTAGCIYVFPLQVLHSSQSIWSVLMESVHAEQQVLMKNLWPVISAIDQPEPQL